MEKVIGQKVVGVGESNWGQIPIQDNDLHGEKQRQSKLNSDPNYAVSRRKITRTPEPQLGQSPLSFYTARTVRTTVLNWNLTPNAGAG
jgi:hypothetical protein